jgi:hypothetical protein
VAREENKAGMFTKYGIWQLLCEDKFYGKSRAKSIFRFPFGMAELSYLLLLNVSFMSVCLKLKHDREAYRPVRLFNFGNSATDLGEPGYFEDAMYKSIAIIVYRSTTP